MQSLILLGIKEKIQQGNIIDIINMLVSISALETGQ